MTNYQLHSERGVEEEVKKGCRRGAEAVAPESGLHLRPVKKGRKEASEKRRTCHLLLSKRTAQEEEGLGRSLVPAKKTFSHRGKAKN